MANELAEELEALQSIYSPEEVDITHPQEGNKPASVTLKADEQLYCDIINGYPF